MWPSRKRVAGTTIGPLWVSTIWLGIDHGWGSGEVLIFETMVYFDGPSWIGDSNMAKGWFDDVYRYSTEAAALAGHAVICAMAQWVFNAFSGIPRLE